VRTKLFLASVPKPTSLVGLGTARRDTRANAGSIQTCSPSWKLSVAVLVVAAAPVVAELAATSVGDCVLDVPWQAAEEDPRVVTLLPVVTDQLLEPVAPVHVTAVSRPRRDGIANLAEAKVLGVFSRQLGDVLALPDHAGGVLAVVAAGTHEAVGGAVGDALDDAVVVERERPLADLLALGVVAAGEDELVALLGDTDVLNLALVHGAGLEPELRLGVARTHEVTVAVVEEQLRLGRVAVGVQNRHEAELLVVLEELHDAALNHLLTPITGWISSVEEQ